MARKKPRCNCSRYIDAAMQKLAQENQRNDKELHKLGKKRQTKAWANTAVRLQFEFRHRLKDSIYDAYNALSKACFDACQLKHL